MPVSHTTDHGTTRITSDFASSNAKAHLVRGGIVSTVENSIRSARITVYASLGSKYELPAIHTSTLIHRIIFKLRHALHDIRSSNIYS